MQSVVNSKSTGWLRYVSSAALAVAITFGGVTVASAQDGDQESESGEEASGGKEKARQALKLIRSGKKAYQSKDYEKAYENFKKAYELNPSPSILVPLGRTSEQLERPRQAIRYYKKFLEKKPDAEKIAKRIEQLRATLAATVTFESKPSKATVYLGSADGEKLGKTPFETEVDPGEQTFVAVRDGYKEARESVTLEGDESTSVAFELEKEKKKKKRRQAAAPPPSSSGGSDGIGLGTFGWGSAAVGVAGIGTGVVFSILANSAANDVNSFNRGASGASRDELQSLKDTANSRYRTSLVAYTAGGTLTALGVGMLTVHFLTRDRRSGMSWSIDGGVRDGGAWAGFRTRF